MSTSTGDEKGGRPQQPTDSALDLPLLTTLLQDARAQRTPKQLGLEEQEGRGRRAAGPEENVPGVSKKDMASKLNVSPATYGRMEGGNGKWTEAQVEIVTEALALDPEQRRTLYALTLGHYPRTEPGMSWGSDSDTHLLEFVQSIPVLETRGKYGVILSRLTYATDADFNVLGHNGIEALFNGRKVPSNILKWGLGGGNGQLLEYGKYLRTKAVLRVEAMRDALSEDDPSVREFDEIIRSLPPVDPKSARPPRGLQEDVFRFRHPDHGDGWNRSIEFHVTGGTLGVPDGRKIFSLTYAQGPLEALEAVRVKNLRAKAERGDPPANH
ncbi:helix-turn-helix domain-containing protein [Streptomyces sp. NPDC058595]|uniref:helix-turn-helix domain-containing protein n=1 Tax=Streptomyces sp. NPDC058595 TaxID=3346550 RepID=UPI0036469E44